MKGANSTISALTLPSSEWKNVLAEAVRKSSFLKNQETDKRERLFWTVRNSAPENFRSELTSALLSVQLHSEAMLAPLSNQNLLHFALENRCQDNAEVIIEMASDEVLLQRYDVMRPGCQGKRNALHRVTELNAVPLARALAVRLSTDQFQQLMKEETAVIDSSRRPRALPCLHLAVFKCHEEMVDFFLAHGTDVNHLNAMGDSALLWAARVNHLNISKALLAAGADSNLANDKGLTPLYWAVVSGHKEMVKLLVDPEIGGADVTTVSKLGMDAPVVLASSSGHIDILKILLEHGADPNFEIRGRERPLHHAAREGHVTAVETLLAAGADKDAADERGDTALTLAAQHGRLDVLELLIRQGASVICRNHECEDVWFHAVQRDGDVMLRHLVVTLIEVGEITVNGDGGDGSPRLSFGCMQSPLLRAAAAGLCEKITTLLEMALDPQDSDKEGNTLLHLAALNNHAKVIAEFASKVGVDVANKAGDTPLHLACRHGHQDAIKALLASKAKANVRNGQGQTALHVLAGCAEVTSRTVRVMVNYAKKPNAWESLHVTDADGCNALHIAAKHAKPDVMVEFQNVRLKERDKHGNLPLHLAAQRNELEVLDVMLNIFEVKKRDANINERNDKKESVLHLAASAGFARAVSRLVRLGADLALPDEAGDTVLHRLTRAMVQEPDKERTYMQVVEAVLAESVWWWCARHHVPYPGCDNAVLHGQYRRRAVVELVRQTFNQADLSCLTLACQLGAAPLLKHLLMLDGVMRFEKDGHVRYDVTDLAPITHRGLQGGNKKTSRRFSGLEHLWKVKRCQAVGSILDIPPVSIMENCYSKITLAMSLILLVLHIAYMAVFSYLSVTLLNRLLYTPDDDNFDVIRILLYIIVPIEPTVIVLHALYAAVRHPCLGELAHQVRLHPGSKRFHLKTVLHFIPTIVVHLYSLIYALCVIAWIVLFSTRYTYQDYFLATALCWGWLLTITFTRGLKPIHYFWKMLQNIILKDVLKFLFVYVFVLLAFSLALHVIFQVSVSLLKTYPTPVDTAFATFKLMLGIVDLFDSEFKADMESVGRSDWMAKVVYLCYIALATIVLLNLLIAMMNDSYAAILARQRLRWKIDAVQLGLDTERSFPILFKVLARLADTSALITKMFRRVHRGKICPDMKDDEDCWYIETPFEKEQEMLGRTQVQEVVLGLEERVRSLEVKLTEQLRLVQEGMGRLERHLPRPDSP